MAWENALGMRTRYSGGREQQAPVGGPGLAVSGTLSTAPSGGERRYGQGNCASVNEVMLRQANTMAQIRMIRFRVSMVMLFIGRVSGVDNIKTGA